MCRCLVFRCGCLAVALRKRCAHATDSQENYPYRVNRGPSWPPFRGKKSSRRLLENCQRHQIPNECASESRYAYDGAGDLSRACRYFFQRGVHRIFVTVAWCGPEHLWLTPSALGLSSPARRVWPGKRQGHDRPIVSSFSLWAPICRMALLRPWAFFGTPDWLHAKLGGRPRGHSGPPPAARRPFP